MNAVLMTITLQMSQVCLLSRAGGCGFLREESLYITLAVLKLISRLDWPLEVQELKVYTFMPKNPCLLMLSYC